MFKRALEIRLPSVETLRRRLGLSEEQWRFLWRALLLALGVWVGLLLASYIIGLIIIGRENTPLGNILLEILNRWDAPHYLRVAEVGYRDEAEDRLLIVFFPLYPLAIRVVHFVIPSYLVSGLVVSSLATVAAGFFLQSLARLDGDDEEANRSLWYFFLFPTAYFLFLPYTEALFVALVLGSFFAARRRRWTWAGILGMLACATRMQGLALVPALAFEALWQERWRAPLRAFWLLLVPVGFVSYLAINWVVLGDPLEFVEIQRDHWSHTTIWPWESLTDALRHVRADPSGPFRTQIFEFRLAAIAFAAALLIGAARWLRPSYQIYAWVGMIFLMSVTFQISMPRYLLALFPLFLIMARLGRTDAVHHALLSASAVLMGSFFVIYATRFGF
jgi:hypothetical protein